MVTQMHTGLQVKAAFNKYILFPS